MPEFLQFYGLTIAVESAQGELVGEVCRDFAFFHLQNWSGKSDVVVDVRLEPPPYDTLPALPASVFTPRNVSYFANGVSYIDYFGRGLALYRRREHHCLIFSTNLHLLREIVYLFILSTVGQYLDARGLHRLHALAVSYQRKAALLVLPSGGGKSTMALELLRLPDIDLLSEDTPLIDRRGRVLPFHLPLGIRAEEQTTIPACHLRTVPRMEFGPKTLIDLDFFGGRLGREPVDPGWILIGQRNLGDQSGIEPLGYPAAFRALVKYMVVGLGVYQGLEFLLERGLVEAMGKVGVGVSRLRNTVGLLRRAPAFRFVLGRNVIRNRDTLVNFFLSAAKGHLRNDP